MAPKSGRESPSQSGITSTQSGDRVIAASTRPDGTLRKEIRVRPGYRPPEDVEVYKNRTAEAFKNRGKGGVPGARFENAPPAKQKEQREKKQLLKAVGEQMHGSSQSNGTGGPKEAEVEEAPKPEAEPFDPEAEKEKEARKLSKKLRQARELQQKKEKGAALLPEQFQKVIQIQELIRQLDGLGFDQEGVKNR